MLEGKEWLKTKSIAQKQVTPLRETLHGLGPGLPPPIKGG